MTDDRLAAATDVLASLAGTWQGGGQVWLPTRPASDFDEEIRFTVRSPTSLKYWQHATHATDGSPSHSEVGIWRVVEDGTLEVSVAIAGAVEVSEGSITPEGIVLTSRGVVRASTSHRFAGTTRRYRFDGDAMTYEVDLATVSYPLTSHLRAELRRVG